MLFSLYEEEPSRGRPASLAEPPGPQERVPQRTVELMLETFVPVPSLEVPVPQMVGQLVEVVRLIDTVVPEQVIDVPKIIPKTSSRSALCSACRRWQNSWWTSPCPPSTTSSLLRKKRRSSRVWSLSRTSGTLLAVSGAGSSVRMGVYWWMIGTSTVQWTPPERAAVGTPVVGVPVIMQPAFLQSVLVPQVQFLDRVWDIPVVLQ